MLNWLLIIELVLLAIVGVMGLIGLFIGKQDPNDPIYRFCTTFWREFLWPPEVMPIDAADVVISQRSFGSSGGSRRSSARAKDETSDDDAFYGRAGKDGGGRNLKTDLPILVVPNAPSDAVLGRDGNGLRIQVTGEPGESRANKTLIELVANAVGVQAYQVTLTKGHYQPRKTVQIQGLSKDELQTKLADLAEVD